MVVAVRRINPTSGLSSVQSLSNSRETFPSSHHAAPACCVTF